MRLKILEEGFPWWVQPQIALIRRIFGMTPGPVAVASRRARLFGRNFGSAMQQAMRGAREWSAVDTELMAAFVSQQNSCSF